MEIQQIAPVSRNFTLVDADDVEEAIMSYMEDHLKDCYHYKCSENDPSGGSKGETVYFGVFKVINDPIEYVGRYFFSGIGRVGGIKVKNPLECSGFEDVAQKLKFSLDLFDGAPIETYEDAMNRKHSK